MDYRTDFDRLDWQSPMQGVRCRVEKRGDRQLRLVEYTEEMPPHWCEKGHVGMILEGDFEIEFPSGTQVFRRGDGVFIPPGHEHRHRARVLTKKVVAVFVEDV
jgi:quercetin dioxygenase-like cupin family protein